MVDEERSFDKIRRKMVGARIEFMAQLAKFSREQLQAEIVTGEWSPLGLAYHLYLTEGLVLQLLQRVQQEENPALATIEELAPHIAPTGIELSLEQVLAGMAARREESFAYLSSLPEEIWLRPFQQGDWGDRKFYQLANLLYLHDQTHTHQLAEMFARTTP